MSTNAQPKMLFYWQANPQVFVVVHRDLNSNKFNPFPHFMRNIMHSLIILTSHRNSVYSTWYFHSHLLKWHMHFLILQAQLFLSQFKGNFTIEYSLLIKVLLFAGCYMMGLWWILPHIQIQLGHLLTGWGWNKHIREDEGLVCRAGYDLMSIGLMLRLMSHTFHLE